jgi:dipeptidyl aminopeptidase/acylaminoacyl peptidase
MKSHTHHTIPRSRGGTDESWNLVELDPYTHAYEHALDFVLFDHAPRFDFRHEAWALLPEDLKEAVKKRHAEWNSNYFTGITVTDSQRNASRENVKIATSGRSKEQNVKQGKVEKRWITTTDGKQMLTWIIFPPDFDSRKRYPTLLYCQGGPQSMVSQYFSYRWNFQLMANNGYIVIAPNRRGLPGFGSAWNDAIIGDYSGQCMRDYLSAVDEISKENYVAKEKRAAVGASFGGYSVYWLAGNHQKRFKTFVAHCGMFNIESWYGTTEEMFFANNDNKGPYWQAPRSKNYDNSPHKFIQNWDSPMLVIHNEKDFRVPLGQGQEAFNAAQLKGLPSRFLYFPDENHWVTKPQNSILWQRVFFEWLDYQLK